MIFGIGVDLVQVARIGRAIERWGDRFVNRVFLPEEARRCYERVFPDKAFALRFAAKEAFSKALGTGMRQGVRWRDIETINHRSGKPSLILHGHAERLCREHGITGTHLSLSDDGDYGVATVVLETG